MNDKEFFNSIAQEWDKICCHPEEKVNYFMDKIELNYGASVLDVGSGTGILIPFIEDRIGEEGTITALDISENMINISKSKNTYLNVKFEVVDFLEYDTDSLFDYIIAYSCFPHFKDKDAFFRKVSSLLIKGGKFVIGHIESKEQINNRHNQIEGKIHSDALIPIEEMTTHIEKYGFNTIYSEDNKDYYIYIGNKI